MRNGIFIYGGYGHSAVKVAQEYNLGQEKVTAAALKGYEQAMADGDYRDAAEIAKKCGLGNEKVKAARTLEKLHG